MKVAITGAGGFVGRQVTKRLAEAGLPVRRLARSPLAGSGGEEAVLLPPVDAASGAFALALEGVTHLVHCAALTNLAAGTPEVAYLEANVRLTERLAEAAASAGVEKFVFLSSTRAVVGAAFDGTVTAETRPAPTDAYGRSKLAAEKALEAAFANGAAQRLAILRLAAVYGPGMRGNLERLMRLADTPLPLPFASLPTARSLVAVSAVAELVLSLLQRPAGQSTYLVADRRPATLAEIVAAFRKGLGRPRRLLPVPRDLLALPARLAGKSDAFQAMAASQIIDTSSLAAERLPQRESSLEGLRDAAAAWVSAGRPRS